MSIWLQITAGRGPAECCWAVGQLTLAIEKEAKEKGTKLDKLEETPGKNAGTYYSMVFSVDLDEPPEWLRSWIGTVQWIGESPYRANYGRKNWFVGVQILKQPDPKRWNLDDKNLKIETFRSSGAGGQNVNKVATAVRVTHLPTGRSVTSQEERSQYQNRRLAYERLKRQLQAEDERCEASARRQLWDQHSSLVRGNPVRVYAGANFIRIR